MGACFFFLLFFFFLFSSVHHPVPGHQVSIIPVAEQVSISTTSDGTYYNHHIILESKKKNATVLCFPCCVI
jgi:hypothetical protein